MIVSARAGDASARLNIDALVLRVLFYIPVLRVSIGPYFEFMTYTYKESLFLSPILGCGKLYSITIRGVRLLEPHCFPGSLANGLGPRTIGLYL